MQNNDSLPIGTILDSGVRKYEIKSVLGKGGFGITYLATSTVYVDNIPLEGQFAIKEHFISSMNERQGVSVSISNVNNTDEIKESIDSFLVEAQRLNKLSLNHSGLVRVNESFRANGTAYYVMEYVKGQSLRDYIKHSHQGRLSEADALQLFRPIADTIDYLHDNMVTHLDIKPDNILIRESGDPVVIDFGLSKHYSSKGTPTSTIKAAGCSAGYSPMEQYAGITSFSPEADIYALGATLLYMLTGKDPMISTEIKSDYVVNVLSGIASEPVIVAISHAMAKLSEERTHSISSFISDLTGNDFNRMDEPVQPQIQHDNNKTKKKRHTTSDNSMEEDYAVKNPIEAIRVAFIRISDFTGNSSRSEFWWSIPLLVICWMLCTISINNIPVEIHSLIGYNNYFGEFVWNLSTSLFSFFLTFIMMGICTRRLHDAGYGDWMVLIPTLLCVYITFCFWLGGVAWFFYLIIILSLASLVVLLVCFKGSRRRTSGSRIISFSPVLYSFLILALLLTVFAGIKTKQGQQRLVQEISQRYTEYNEYVNNCQQYLSSFEKANEDIKKLDNLVIALDNYRNIVVMEKQFRNYNPNLFNQSEKLIASFPSTVPNLISNYIEQAKKGQIFDYARTIGALQLAKEFTPSEVVDSLYNSVIAEAGYIKINKIEFCNKADNVVDDFGSTLYASKMRYLVAKVYYDWLENPSEVNIDVKIINPSGHIDSNDKSPKGYTFSDTLREYGSQDLVGWGNDTESFYDKGVWTYEIWHENKKIYSTKINLN